MKVKVVWTYIITTIVLAGCDSAAGRTTPAVAGSDTVVRARQDSVNRAQPGYVVDSLLPIDEEIRRFTQAVGGDAATAFSGGAPSRDSLLQLFADALERRDTATLVHALITPREFIDLYYPSSPHTRAPYRQAPGFLWSQMSLTSSKGLSRLVERRGGVPLHAARMTCDAAGTRQGENRIWSGCAVHIRGASQSERLFGAIIERGGVYKFLSYSNQY